jgi:uncharacterized protein (DUF433 family)
LGHRVWADFRCEAAGRCGGGRDLCDDGAPAKSRRHADALLSRITANPKIFGGKPIIRGMRISVELILSLLAQGETAEAILDDYPDLAAEDIRACLAYAHAVIADHNLDAVRVD